MFQSFSATRSPETGPKRLELLRAELRREGLEGFLVPRSDAYRGENVAPRDERLAWLTGFTGSAGSCLALLQGAGIFVDSRYSLQVRAQVDIDAFTPVPIPEASISDWLLENLNGGGTIGYDPWLHGSEEIEKLTDAVADRQITLRPVDNLVDRIWHDQPDAPTGQVLPHPVDKAGESHGAKRRRLAEVLVSDELQAVVLTVPDSIAWLLNIRGSDIARTPVPHCFAILNADGSVDLFLDAAKTDAGLKAHLGRDVRLHSPEGFGPALDALSGEVAVDRTTAPVWIIERLRTAGVAFSWRKDPCVQPKATKNPVEIAGARAAHLRDAAAFARFLCWLDAEAPKGNLTEIDVVGRLEEFRRNTGCLRDISFETICGAGPNGAIVHYRVTEETNRAVTPGELLLVDSGAQYEDGTTDITRTLAIGPVDPGTARAFTLVLKGMMAIAALRWPEGLAGRDLDAVARVALWNAGLDYDHGTGHGVGSYLGVHEGPQSLSKRGDAALLPGMIISDEPGYYKEGAFGIRIENLLVVQEPEIPDGGERPMLGFETLTLAPIDRRLIVAGLLSDDERRWLDNYHARVLDAVGPALDPETLAWLAITCAPL